MAGLSCNGWFCDSILVLYSTFIEFGAYRDLIAYNEIIRKLNQTKAILYTVYPGGYTEVKNICHSEQVE